MDKTTMEKPEQQAKNFSIVVPYSAYKSLQGMAALTHVSLGSVCRQLLSIIPYKLYTQLQAKAFKEQIDVTTLCRRILENAVKK